MRAAGIDPVTYRPTVVASSNTKPIAEPTRLLPSSEPNERLVLDPAQRASNRRSHTGEPLTADGHRVMLIPVPPFRDEDDRRAALGAALVHVTHAVTGRWPTPDSVLAAIAALRPRTDI
jgi:hypothetical protein